jgi:hypothetical protein
MKVAVHQPNYLPWPGFFHKMFHCDVFVLLDNVQYPRRGFCNRTMVKSPQGKAVWLTVPVMKSRYAQQIRDVQLFQPEENLAKQHLTLQHFYGRAPYYRHLADRLEAVFAEKWMHLAPLNVMLIKVFADILGIHTPLLLASSLGELTEGKSGRIIALCQKLGADTYLSGEGGRAYNDSEAFAAAGIKLVYQKFVPPCYPQGGGNYLSGLSVLDLIAHTGSASRQYLFSADS